MDDTQMGQWNDRREAFRYLNHQSETVSRWDELGVPTFGMWNGVNGAILVSCERNSRTFFWTGL
jgi:hypothetical protein